MLEVRQAAFARDFNTALPREKQMVPLVQYTWKDLRTGKILSRKQHELIIQAVDYIPPVGETFFIGSQEAIERLAERIVESMEPDDW